MNNKEASSREIKCIFKIFAEVFKCIMSFLDTSFTVFGERYPLSFLILLLRC